MSVPPDRMAVRPAGDPNKIMGLKKPVFWAIIGAGAILFAYLWYRSRHNSDVAAGTGPVDNTQGLTAADIGGTPADNSFATQTDQTALEEQLQQMQDALFQLENSNGGNGAGLPSGNPGGNPGSPSGGDSGSLSGQNPEIPPTGLPGTNTGTGSTTGSLIGARSPEVSPVGSLVGSGVRYFYNPPTQPVLSQNQTAVHPVTFS